MGVSAMTLYSTPGLSLFNQVAGGKVRGNYTITTGPGAGRTFKVVDTSLIEEFTDGTINVIGQILNDGNPVSFAACPQQLAIVSDGQLYSYQLATQTVPTLAGGNVTYQAGTLQLVAGPWQVAVTQVAYVDGFFFVLCASSQTLYASNGFDATTWPPLAIKTINTYADNVVGIFADHRYLWIFGAKQTEVDYDAGSFPFPLQTMPSGFIEGGCAAPFALSELDNAIFLIGARNDLGQAIAYRTNGFSFVRISTHAVETAWQRYVKISDAISFGYQENGHTFWVVTFPSAQATWAYDVATGLWHKRAYWNQNLGRHQAALPICHTFNFGKHLVGDRQSGNTYQMSSPVQVGSGWNFVTDNGALIRRVRTAPHINVEHQWQRYSQLEIYLETGLGPQPPLLNGAGNPVGPQLMLRCSRDGGRTYGEIRTADCGQAGDYLQRATFRRLGRARDMVFEVSMTDPVPWRFIDAYINPKTQPSPRKRLTAQYAEIS